MALLVDKYRPRSLEALTYHENLSKRLKSLVRFSNRSVEYRSSLMLGAKRRLPPSSCLWTFRRGEEDEDSRNITRALWAGCREDQN